MDGQTFVPGQGNNSYIFPGVGLGIVASQATRVTDEMFSAAAVTLMKEVTEQDLKTGCIYPPLSRIRDVSAKIAAAVAQIVFAQGLTDLPMPTDMLDFVKQHMIDPTY